MARGGARMHFKRVWAWSEPIEKFIKQRIKGRSLHVCCGISKIGDIKVDNFVIRKDIIKADMFEMPFKEEFDTVICDPPWELPYHKRAKLLYSLRNVLKPGGILILRTLWWPQCRGMEVKEYWLAINYGIGGTTSLLIVAQKVNHSLDRNYEKTQKR